MNCLWPDWGPNCTGWGQGVDAVLHEKNLERDRADNAAEEMKQVGSGLGTVEREGPLEPCDLLYHCQTPYELADP